MPLEEQQGQGQTSMIVNGRLYDGSCSPGTALADFLRENLSLKGTTIACREGDCGACTVIVRGCKGQPDFSTVTSCISPVLNAWGRSVVTVEGLGLDENHPLQKLFAKYGASQCGFCTPGFVVSLIAACVSPIARESWEEFRGHFDGNICRCTGYKSIERAANEFYQTYIVPRKSDNQNQVIDGLIAEGIIPEFFRDEAPKASLGGSTGASLAGVGGGTDLLVQRPESIAGMEDLRSWKDLAGDDIVIKGDSLLLGGAVSIETFRTSPVVAKFFPTMKSVLKLFASTQIRNQGTIAGNLVNASPIGDITSILLALGAELRITGPRGERRCALGQFYQAYKTVDLKPGERIDNIAIRCPEQERMFSFEKVSKRQFLDISTVNTAMTVAVNDGIIKAATISAGGVAAIPMVLSKASQCLVGHEPSTEVLLECCQAADSEVRPISDVRGTSEYKKLLLRQLIIGHFVYLFGDIFDWDRLL